MCAATERLASSFKDDRDDRTKIRAQDAPVTDGFVQLCSEAGKPIGRKVALNGDDPARIAARLPNPRSVGEDEAT